MAKNEHQGLKIALILFVMVTVVLAITTFVFYQSSDREFKRSADAEKAKQDAEARANTSDDRFKLALHILGIEKLSEAEVNRLKTGLGNDGKVKGVLASYDQHMASYGAGLPPEERTYADVLPKLLMNVRQLNTNNLNQVAAATKAIADRDATQQAETARTNEALQAQKKAQDDHAAERSKYTADRAKLQSDQTTQFASLNAEVKNQREQMNKASSQVQQAQKEKNTLQSTVDTLKKTIEDYRDEPFEVADGQVVTVNQGAKLVWINLGMADGLRRQTMFSIYDKGVTGVNAEPKASIEVTDVINQHLAEGKISYSNPANPILPGDQVFSPAWRPGRRVRFAIAGFMDVDGDGRSDRNLLRGLISSSGGNIDYEVHDDGTVVGEMKAGIRYLILGDSGADRQADLVNRKLIDEYSNARQQATQLGIEIISLDQFLSWAGYRPEIRTHVVGLGKNADSSQFKAKPDEGRSRTSTNVAPDVLRNPSKKKTAKDAPSATAKPSR